MKSNGEKTEFQILQELFEDQRAGARDQNHPIHKRKFKSPTRKTR